MAVKIPALTRENAAKLIIDLGKSLSSATNTCEAALKCAGSGEQCDSFVLCQTSLRQLAIKYDGTASTFIKWMVGVGAKSISPNAKEKPSCKVPFSVQKRISGVTTHYCVDDIKVTKDQADLLIQFMTALKNSRNLIVELMKKVRPKAPPLKRLPKAE